MDGARAPRRPDLRLRETDHAQAADPALPVLRRQGPLHPERGAPGRQELSALWHARRTPRMAGEAVRSHADPPDEARRPRRDEDRDARIEGRGREEGRERREEGLAKHRPALQAVAPVLADRPAALPALVARRRLIRFDDDQFRTLELVPP